MRKHAKRVLCLLAAALMLLTACGAQGNINVLPQPEPQPQPDPQPQEPDFSQFDDQFVTCPTDENLAVLCRKNLNACAASVKEERP